MYSNVQYMVFLFTLRHHDYTRYTSLRYTSLRYTTTSSFIGTDAFPPSVSCVLLYGTRSLLTFALNVLTYNNIVMIIPYL